MGEDAAAFWAIEEPWEIISEGGDGDLKANFTFPDSTLSRQVTANQPTPLIAVSGD
jgi:hypothetical protein